MKKLLAIIFLLALLPLISSQNLTIDKLSSGEVYVVELDNMVHYELNITNVGADSPFGFYNLVGLIMSPSEKIHINRGESKIVDLYVKPIDNFQYRDTYQFGYFLEGGDGEDYDFRLSFNAIELKDVFEIGSSKISPEDNSIEIYVKNKINKDFKDVKIDFSSPFFEYEDTFDIGPNARKTFDIELDSDEFNQLTAGFYTLNADVTVEGKTASTDGTIEFLEKDLLTTSKQDYGFFINTIIVEKKNDGNLPVDSETRIDKNIISRLFTSFSPEPDFIERDGFNVKYIWSRELNPGEVLRINVTTNWLFPILAILLIVIIIFLAKQYLKTDLILRKRVSFVRAKGGEFALKVNLFVRARSYVERVSIMDRLPPLVKLYEKFGNEKPSKVNEKVGKLEWNFEKLEEGETRTISYIIYSKVGVMGRFALPSATAIYERDGKIKESSSNKAFFVAEQRTKDIEE